MSKLLYLLASPLVDRSYSVAVADAFVDAYRAAHPNDTVVRKDLFTENLPTFDGFKLAAKYALLHGRTFTQEQKEAWRAVENAIQEFKSADKYVLAVPMWNFGIPYRLKQYFDLIVQPGLTFSFSPAEGYKGLVTGKPLLAVVARGGEYPAGSPAEKMDFQKPYLETILRFIGFTDLRWIVVEPTLAGGEEAAERKRAQAIEAARTLAAGF